MSATEAGLALDVYVIPFLVVSAVTGGRRVPAAGSRPVSRPAPDR